MKKSITGQVLGWTLATALSVATVFGGVVVAKAQMLNDTVTTTIDWPMFSVAKSGLDLTVGSVSPSVQTLEAFLQNRGYFPNNVTPDQVFDGNTRNALALYQAQAHVLSTGYFGPHTRAHMAVVLWFKMHGLATRTN